MKLPPARWSPAASIELLTAKKQCKRIFHGNEWMKEHNYAFQNADTRPRLQRRTQNICFVISISAVILKRMVKITSIFGSYRFLRIAWHDIFSLSHHLLASWNMYSGGGQGGREPGRTGGGRGTGDGRRKGGKRDLYDGGKRERNSKRQAFVNCYCSLFSQRNEPNNVSWLPFNVLRGPKSKF